MNSVLQRLQDLIKKNPSVELQYLPVGAIIWTDKFGDDGTIARIVKKTKISKYSKYRDKVEVVFANNQRPWMNGSVSVKLLPQGTPLTTPEIKDPVWRENRKLKKEPEIIITMVPETIVTTI